MRIVKREVVVNTKSERAFKGVLWSRSFDLLVLKKAVLLQPGGGTIPLDGDTVIFKKDVDFMQVL